MKARWILPVYWVTCFIATHMPPDNIPHVEVPFIDKLVHFGMYFGLALMLTEALPKLGKIPILGIVLAYVFLDEGTQPGFGRALELWDGLADMAGAVSAVLAHPWMKRQAVPLGRE